MPPKAESKVSKAAPESSGGAAGASADSEALPSSVRGDAAADGDRDEEDWRASYAVLKSQLEALTAVVAELKKAATDHEASVGEMAFKCLSACMTHIGCLSHGTSGPCQVVENLHSNDLHQPLRV
jgi:hypothetical protein